LKKIINILTIIPRYLYLGIKVLFSEEKQKELKIEKKIIPTIIITLSIVTYLICIFILSRWYVQNERNKKFGESLIQSTEEIEKEESKFIEEYKNLNIETNIETNAVVEYLNIDLSQYINQNTDTVAWLQVNGTNINYPVVQHDNNEYYLDHDFYKRKTNIGWVFADYRNNFNELDNNTILYAHNLINRTMFGQLPYLTGNNWLSNPNNFYIKLSTRKENTIWQIFSVYKIEPTIDYLQVRFYSAENYQKFLNTIKNRSSHNFNVDVTYKDKIITLSTCDDTGTKRVVVHGKLISLEKK
jgi:sortase B